MFLALQCQTSTLKLPSSIASHNPKRPTITAFTIFAKETNLPHSTFKSGGRGGFGISTHQRSNFLNGGNWNGNSLTLAVQEMVLKAIPMARL
ncbi:hypothetical protein JCGZ_21399 [Jatropha curcas]|uniref:Uncharacterized protein n=1 Tax=Jatropha curcas TaxID=180498 RepID=A0A067JDT7_JATCU|nr:hypothetical protein JCGZ_21399 [Jatropha curcas]